MPARFVNGQPLHNAGSPVIRSEPCCCQDVPCTCDILKSGLCECVNGAFGDDRAAPDMLVTIGGTLPISVPSFECSPTIDTTCGDPRGTYLVSCGDDYIECFGETQWCGDSFNPIRFRRIAVRFQYEKGSILVSLSSDTRRCNQPLTNTGGSVRWNFTRVDDWAYVPSSVCREECNAVTDNFVCADQLDWTFDDLRGDYTPQGGTCDVSGLTISLAAA